MNKLKTFYYALSFWFRSGDDFAICWQNAVYEVEWRKHVD